MDEFDGFLLNQQSQRLNNQTAFLSRIYLISLTQNNKSE